MCNELTDAILDQIDQADLSATAYRTAIRLWRLAFTNGGVVHIERPQMTLLCGTDSDATMRTHLYQIAKAGIVEYRAAAGVFVRFLLWDLRADNAQVRAQRANEGEIEDANLRAQRAGMRADNAQVRAERANEASTSHVRARALGRLGRSLTNTEKEKEPTYPPTSQTPKLKPMQQIAFDLLVDAEVGVIHRVADELARKLPPQDIYRAVDQWLPDAQVGKVTAGALKHRLETLKPSNARMVNLSARFRGSELFHRHRLPDEMVADPERKRYSVEPAQEQGKRYSV